MEGLMLFFRGLEGFDEAESLAERVTLRGTNEEREVKQAPLLLGLR